MFRAIIDRTALPFVVAERDGTIRFASDSLTTISGWRPRELVGRNVFDLVADGQAETALEGLGEILTSEQTDPGIPVVFAVKDRDGRAIWVEVAAMMVTDLPGPDLVAFRIRPWEAERLHAEFLRALLADAPLAEVLEPLTRSITATVEGLGAAVHHDFDGAEFASVVGSWPGAARLPRRGAPWAEAVTASGLVLGGAEPAVLPGGTPTWMIPVSGGPLLQPALLSVWLPEPGPPLLGHRNLLAEAAGYVELALVRNAEHHRLLHLARRDSLTGVWNRATFRELLDEAVQAGEPGLAVAFCDLDGFKEINDDHGHVAGDDVLVNVAARLQNALRAGDELARMGGDEFTVLCRGIADLATAEQVGCRLLAAFEQPFTVPGGVASVGLSVGLALVTPGATVDELLHAADAALYRSKKAGGGRFAVAS